MDPDLVTLDISLMHAFLCNLTRYAQASHEWN